jgi:hypothetical protein
MRQNNRFLSVSVDMGKISPETRELILRIQRSRSNNLPGNRTRCGDILVDHGILDKATCEEIAQEQQRRRQNGHGNSQLRWRRSKRLSPDIEQKVTLMVMVLAASVATIAVTVYDFPWPDALEITGFMSVIVISALLVIFPFLIPSDYSILLSLYKSIKSFPVFIAVILSIYALANTVRLQKIATLHTRDNIRVTVESWLFDMRISLSVMGISLLILALALAWRNKSQLFVQARIGILKDIIVRVENIMRQGLPIEKRQKEAAIVLLNGLHTILRLSAWDWIVRIINKSATATTVAYLVPDIENKHFKIENVVFPIDAPHSVKEVFEWIKVYHRPCFLNEGKFQKLKDQARGRDPNGWKERFLNFRDLNKIISATGWIYARQKPLFSHDASRSIAFDSDFIVRMKEYGFSNDAIRWVEVRSFAGYPVFGLDQSVNGVLLVLRRMRNGFRPEDFESIITVSVMLSRIMSLNSDEIGTEKG